MLKSGIDQQALIEMFSTATAKQTEQLRKAVAEATLKALQGREMSLKNIRGVVKTVTEAASAGAAKSALPQVDIGAMLDTAVAGMDDALLKAVDANRMALEQFVGQGVSLQDKQLKKAMGDLEKFEDTLFDTVRKAAGGAAATPLAGPWAEVLGKMEKGGSLSGAQAVATVEQMTTQMQTAIRDTRAASLKAAQALADSYTALVSGVLIGMSDALRQGGSAPPAKTSGKK